MGTLTLFCKKNWNSQIFSFTLHPKRLKKQIQRFGTFAT